jgi:hypothetical protein
LINIFPHRPNSSTGWFMLVAASVPIWLFLEWLGMVVFSKRIGEKISDKPYSGARILYIFGVLLAFFVGMFLLWIVLGPYVRPYFS